MQQYAGLHKHLSRVYLPYKCVPQAATSCHASTAQGGLTLAIVVLSHSDRRPKTPGVHAPTLAEASVETDSKADNKEKMAQFHRAHFDKVQQAPCFHCCRHTNLPRRALTHINTRLPTHTCAASW